MGTGSDDSNTKETAKKQHYVMARLYRGLLDIIRSKNDSTMGAIIAHVRSFDQLPGETEESYTGVLGFWRMLVEMVFQVYTQLCLFGGVLLVFTLVIISWPIRFLIELFSGSFGIFHKYNHVMYEQPHIQPTMDPVTEPAGPNDKVVRRVVYEETKVPKK